MAELIKDSFGEVITSRVPNPKIIYPPQEIIEPNKRLDEVNSDGSTIAMEKYDTCREIRREFALPETQK